MPDVPERQEIVVMGGWMALSTISRAMTKYTG